MKKVLLISILAGFFCSSTISAQEEEKSFGITFKGFVKNDFFWDSRQVTTAREGHFLLWPAAVVLDANGNDINAKPTFNFLSVQSRLSGVITGPDAFGAKTSGLIEGDFFAQQNDNINLFRLRHAFVKLNWKNTELMTGQYWNPLFVTACFPGTISFNTGTPIQSFSRNPQIRVTQQFGKVSLLGAALSQRDYTSRGPDPADNTKTISASEFLRNSAIPDVHFQIHYATSDAESGNSFCAGSGLAYKTIVPRLEATSATSETYRVDEKVSGLTAIVFTKVIIEPVTAKFQARYGENLADVLSLSGFAVKSYDPATGAQTYTPLKNISAWGELHTNGKKFQTGIFAGITKNMGTKEEMSDAANMVYGLGTNIESLIRVSPRVLFISNRTKIACEVEFTGAKYGSDYDVNYIAAVTEKVKTFRLLMSIMYSF